MKNISYSLHKVTDRNSCPFSETEYSRFKFGDSAVARKFAEELFHGFIAQHSDAILEARDIVLLPSPYHAIPTASNYLCHYFKVFLNRYLYDHGRRAVAESKIYRNQTYTTDYGNLSFTERVNLISNDTYYIDGNYIAGKLCLFLDDIKITGSHELIVKKVLEQHDVQGDFMFLYYGELINKDIHPNIENYYNYFYVKDVESLCSIINSDNFVFNTRTVKYILKLERPEIEALARSVEDSLLVQLYDLAISNNYHTIDDYKTNLDYINQLINQEIYNYGNQFTERTT